MQLHTKLVTYETCEDVDGDGVKLGMGIFSGRIIGGFMW